jgi:serine/threonine protein kinase
MTASVTLAVVKGRLAGKQFRFEDYQTPLAGRAEDVQLQVSEHRSCSRYHCRFVIQPPDCRVIDLQSRNGTHVNGQRVASAVLDDQDTVRIADAEILVSLPKANSSSDPAVSTLIRHADSVDASHAADVAEVGPYRIVRVVGRGGMGLVFEGRHRITNERAAIKLIQPDRTVDPHCVQLFMREASITMKLKHPRIVECTSFGLYQNQPYLAMEYIDNVDLCNLLHDRQFDQRVRISVGVIRRVLEGLQFAHTQNIVHRDIKPSNILTSHVSGKLKTRVSDFGLAKNFVESGLSGITGDDELRGTLPYMPPEQIINARDARPVCDVYSAGATLYTFLSGQTPFTASTGPQLMQRILEDPHVPILEHCPTLPLKVAQAIERAISRDPMCRFQSADEFRRALT